MESKQAQALTVLLGGPESGRYPGGSSGNESDAPLLHGCHEQLTSCGFSFKRTEADGTHIYTKLANDQPHRINVDVHGNWKHTKLGFPTDEVVTGDAKGLGAYLAKTFPKNEEE